jgi:AbrB family looped-hinge helix DNA binding protein
VSIPAEVRERWNTRLVVIEDEGDHIVLRPTPDDAAEALQGIFAGGRRCSRDRRPDPRRARTR